MHGLIMHTVEALDCRSSIQLSISDQEVSHFRAKMLEDEGRLNLEFCGSTVPSLCMVGTPGKKVFGQVSSHTFNLRQDHPRLWHEWICTWVSSQSNVMTSAHLLKIAHGGSPLACNSWNTHQIQNFVPASNDSAMTSRGAAACVWTACGRQVSVGMWWSLY